MIPLKQTREFIIGKQNGNCWVTCLASILECRIEDFPEFTIDREWESYDNEVRKILRAKGYRYLEHEYLDYSPERNKLIYNDLKEHSVDGYVIAVGESPRSTFDYFFLHSVVWHYKKGLVFDPHKSNLGIKYPMWYGIFEKV